MHSTKYISILALLGVAVVKGRQQSKHAMAQVKSLTTRESCATGVPSYREPSRSVAPESYVSEEVFPTYSAQWTSYYEQPSTPLYYY
jgi:hypothetical protein